MSGSSDTPVARRYLLPAIQVPAVIVLALMMTHVTANAFMRAFMNSPIQNTTEITQYIYLPIIALLGFLAAQIRGEHVVADLLSGVMHGLARRAVLAFGHLLVALITFGFGFYGWGEARDAHAIGQTAGVSDVQTWPVYYLVPLVFLTMSVLALASAVRSLRDVQGMTHSSSPTNRESETKTP